MTLTLHHRNISSMATITMALVAFLFALGCSDPVAGENAGPGFNVHEQTDTGADAGPTAGGDTELDADPVPGADVGPDPGGDAGTDTGADAELDTEPSPGADIGPDPGADAGTDTGADTGPDTGISSDCTDHEQCDDGWVCIDEVCTEPTCDDGLQSGDQTDEDCGGPECPPCEVEQDCETGSDCVSGVCDEGECQEASCVDGVLNGEETDVDCGGPDCPPCAMGQDCATDEDCVTQRCDDGVCAEPEEIVPDPPTDVIAGIGDGELYVSWSAPSYEGSAPIIDYRVTVFDENGDSPTDITGDTSRMVGSDITILTFAGLTNDTSYRFGVEAENIYGFSDMSELSDSVVPQQADVFVSVWNTQLDGTTGFDQIRLPLESTGNYDFVVDWGDGTQDTITDGGQAEITHTYADPGTYTVTITGQIEGWRFAGEGDAGKIVEIQRWGDLRFGNNGAYFHGAENLEITATELPELTGTTNFAQAFHGCASLDRVPLMNHWDMSSVTDMREMFHHAEVFNEDISAWDVSSVGHMRQMFRNAAKFNQDIGDWDTSSVINMDQMLMSASSFNQDIGDWDVGSVTTMYRMFWAVSEFDHDIGDWDTSSLQNVNAMFYGASSFNRDIGDWDVSSVEDFAAMFSNAASFDQDLGNWEVTSATNLMEMFWNVALSTSNYDSLLNGWAEVDVPENMNFHAGDSQYSSDAVDAREFLIEEKGWSISDGGLSN